MPNLVSPPALNVDDALPDSYVDRVKDNLDFLTIAGADLVSAATVVVTHEFHKITGAVTIDNLDHAAEISGQQVRLLFAAALTIRNNGGGTGNVRTRLGSDKVVAINEILSFTFDGTVWRESASAAAIALDGWVAMDALTFSAADAPIYVCTTASDLTALIPLGARIKLTHAAAVKYFIVTAINSTTITLYGGTDYTLAATAITLPFYSREKAPVGFPLNPLKWTVELIDSAIRTQTAPVQNTWYNPGSLSLSVPIGAWLLGFQATSQVSDGVQGVETEMALSTGAATASDADLLVYAYSSPGGSTSNSLSLSGTRSKHVLLAAKTPYYLNIRAIVAGVDNIYIIAGGAAATNTVIRAVCAYL